MSTSIEVITSSRRRREKRNAQLALLLFVFLRRTRRPRYSRRRVDIDLEIEMLLNENMFERTFRLTPESFSHLLGLLTLRLEVDIKRSVNSSGVAPISPAMMLMTTLRYLSGGSYLDIRRTVGISVSSYYRVIDATMIAILALQELRITFPESDSENEVVMENFKAISVEGIMNGCIGCVDGWLCVIKSPTAADAGDVSTGRYFSGHYACPGINVQAICAAHCRSTAIDASFPRSTNDARAFRDTGVSRMLRSLPTGMYIIGDNAYPVDEHLLTPFSRNQIVDEYHDSFNYHASQLRIRIEMSFGLLTTKWSVFRTPIERNLLNATRTINSVMVLHNYVINWRMMSDSDYCIFDEPIRPIRVPGRGHQVNDVANIMGYMSSVNRNRV